MKIPHAPTHRCILRLSDETERWGFVVLAGVEVFHAVSFVWHVNVLLLVSGAGARIYDRINR